MLIMPKRYIRKDLCGQKIDYIHFNPVWSGIVLKPQDYIYSSASNYVGNKGIIDVELVQIPVLNVLNPNSILKYNSYD
jgi:hypothetical protein